MDARFIKGSGRFRKVISKEEFDLLITVMELKIVCKTIPYNFDNMSAYVKLANFWKPKTYEINLNREKNKVVDGTIKLTLIKSRALNKSEGAI